MAGLGLVFSPGSPAFAQEPPARLVIPGTFGDKVYENVKVIGATAQGLKIAHDGGLSVLPFNTLPEPWRAKYSTAPEGGSTPTPAPAAPVMPVPAATPGPATTSGFDPNCLVFIKTDSGCGSGFIARVDGKAYIYTNAHVLCGEPGAFTKKFVSIKTTAGKPIPIPYELELSNTYDPSSPSGLEDMARIPIVLKEGEPAYDIAQLDLATSTNQPVVAYGNSLGGDVMTSLDGHIVAPGADRFEISCPIVSGNSGGPVVLADTRKVVGISTFLTSGDRDIWTRGTKFGEVRRFAIRPEKVTKWRKMQYTSLMTSLAELNAFDRDTLSLAAACLLYPKANRGGFDVPGDRRGDYVIKDILMDGKHLPLGGTITGGVTRVNQRLGGAAGRQSVVSVVPVFAEFFASVASTSSTQMSSLQTSERAPYLKQFVPQLVKIRQIIHEEFVKHGNTFR